MDIFTLTADDLSDYAQTYDADHLKPGDVVWCDDELFMTAADLDALVHERRSAMDGQEWRDGYLEEVERLEDALRRLRAALAAHH